MTIIQLTSDGVIGELVDALLADESHAQHAATLRAVQSVYDKASASVEKAAGNKELTTHGKRQAIRRALEASVKGLEQHEVGVERLGRVVSETRARALARPSGERTVEALMLEREIRDRIVAAGKDSMFLPSDYLRAIERGDDAYVAAVDNAPRAFPLLDDEGRALGEAAKLKRSPLKAQLDALESEHALLGQITRSARTALDDLAKKNGIEAHEIFGATEPTVL